VVRLQCSDELQDKVIRSLTDRDHFICEMLYEHRVLTTDQICDLAFDSLATAQHRLVRLWQLRLVDRFRPRRDVGSAPAHYVLDELGAVVVAAGRGLQREELGWRRDGVLAIATSQRLAHLLGVNQFFCALARAARRRPDSQLVEWWPERRCAAEWDAAVRPDGFGRWRDGNGDVAFFLEYDRGTERIWRLAAKLDGYADVALAGEPVLVLFAFASRGREQEARTALRHADVPVATAVVDRQTAPEGPIWTPLGTSGRRRLAQLSSLVPSAGWLPDGGK
jgi:hypothetical protein